MSVVIPSFNEEENFKKGVLEKVALYLKKFTYSHEVILVDDGSSDGTADLIKGFIRGKKTGI